MSKKRPLQGKKFLPAKARVLQRDIDEPDTSDDDPAPEPVDRLRRNSTAATPGANSSFKM